MTSIRILWICLATMLFMGCATTECFKGDGLYEQESTDCFRFCADANCKYWGHSKAEAEEAFNDAQVAAKSKAEKSCKALNLKEGSADYGACIKTKLKDQGLLEYQQGVNQRLIPNNYYFEK